LLYCFAAVFGTVGNGDTVSVSASVPLSTYGASISRPNNPNPNPQPNPTRICFRSCPSGDPEFSG